MTQTVARPQGVYFSPLDGHPIILDDIDWDKIITEDEAPVDSWDTEQHIGLLTDPLYDSWRHSVYGDQFLVAADVGVFFDPDEPPVVPDVFLVLGVRKPPRAPGRRRHTRDKSYFMWETGKPPDVAIEIVSNHKGGEDTEKMALYARLGVLYYAIYDPELELSEQMFRLYRLENDRYIQIDSYWMPEIELGLKLWRGRHQGLLDTWLRWCDRDGNPIPTGGELARRERRRSQQERRRAEQEQQRAEQEKQRSEQERQRAERLAAQLRALGIEPDEGEGADP